MNYDALNWCVFLCLNAFLATFVGINNKNHTTIMFIYETMTRKELAVKLNISTTTLYRRMKKLPFRVKENIKGRNLLFDRDIKIITEGIGAGIIEA